MSNFKIGDKIYIEAEILKESQNKDEFLVKTAYKDTKKTVTKTYWIDKEFVQEKPIEFPEEGNGYEFSSDCENWVQKQLESFITSDGCSYSLIRPIQNPSPEELQFLKLAEKFKNKYSIKPL